MFFFGDAVPSPDIVGVQRLVALAQSLAQRDGSVATAYVSIPASKGEDRTVRVVAQCARDRGAADCALCLREASLAVARSWEAGGGARSRTRGQGPQLQLLPPLGDIDTAAAPGRDDQ